MAQVPLFPPGYQFTDDNGDPLNGGLVYTYTAGTTTPKATYTDSAGGTPNANPVVLDADGRKPIWGSGSYRIVVKTSAGTTISDDDNYTAFSAGTGTTVTDNSFTIQDNADTTKQMQFQLSGITTGTTTTITVPDGNFTMAKASDVSALTTGYANKGYNSSYYYYGFGCRGQAGTKVVTANRLYVRPFVVGDTATFTRIGLEVTSSSAGNVRLGIYNWANGLPTTVLLDAGTVSTGTTGIKEITISQSLSSGVYGIACIFDATPTIYAIEVNNEIRGHFLGEIAPGSNYLSGMYQSVSYGALGTFSLTATIANGSDIPGVHLRKA